MNESRIALKVGGFVLVGLIFLGVLVVLLSKGTAFSGKHMELRLTSGSVGSIKRGASVVMSGVPVGSVSGVDLGEEGTNVIIFLKVKANRKIYENASFGIEQQGFLGEQYVAIYPGMNQGRLLKDGDTVVCQNPFNLQETVAKAAETINRIGQVTTNVNAAVADVRRLVLTEERLSRLGAAIENFATLIADARMMVSNANVLVAVNSQPTTIAVSNFSYFSRELPEISERIHALVRTNEAGITMAIKNLETSSATLTNIMADLERGRGLAGRLLRDDELAVNLADIARNLSITSSNLTVTTTKLNTRGLWGILWKQKEPPPPEKNGTVPPKS